MRANRDQRDSRIKIILGYNGRTSLEDAQVDMIGDLVFEAWEHLRHWLRETLPSEKVSENVIFYF